MDRPSGLNRTRTGQGSWLNTGPEKSLHRAPSLRGPSPAGSALECLVSRWLPAAELLEVTATAGPVEEELSGQKRGLRIVAREVGRVEAESPRGGGASS